MSNPVKPMDLEGLKGIAAKPLERMEVRSRSSQVTRSAWRLEATSPSGMGTIVMVEISSEEIHFRGEGIFLGWTQERLAAAYEALAPKSNEEDPELPQLG